MSEQEVVMTYELWVKGTLGVHKDKLVLYSVFGSFTEAQVAMHKLLKEGMFATIVRKEARVAV